MLKKLLLVFAAALMVTPLCAAPKKIKIALGAACYAWNKNVVNKPDEVPAGGFVDTATGFYRDTVKRQDGLGRINDACFIMWEGYVRVPRTSDYRFTLITENLINLRIFINGKTLITRRVGDKETTTASASLKKGMVKMRIYANPTSWGGHKFFLKFGRANSMKMTDITPAVMYHQVEDEEE